MKTKKLIEARLKSLQKKLKRIKNSLYATNGADCTVLFAELKHKIQILKWVLGSKRKSFRAVVLNDRSDVDDRPGAGN